MVARQLASMIGKIISMSIALGPVARFITRSIYALLNSQQSWWDVLPISSQAKAEMNSWLTEIDQFNGQGIWHSPSVIRVVYTDTSSTGYGGYTVEYGCHIAHGLWLPEERCKSSTWREFRAVRLVFDLLKAKLKNERVRWFMVNQNVERILRMGSRNPELHKEDLVVFSTALVYHIRVEPEWIPWKENELADYLSQIIDHDNWSLDSEVFRELNQQWGPHIVD